jgi:hypothetical protein
VIEFQSPNRKNVMNLQPARHFTNLCDLDREVLGVIGDREAFDAQGYPDQRVVKAIAERLNRDTNEIYYSLKALRVYCSAGRRR